MTKQCEAIDIFNRHIACRAEEERCITEVCKDCEYNVTMEEMDEAVRVGIEALEFRERYDNFWEEVKAAGMKGEETEIRHSGRVFRIREVAQ